MTGCAGPISVWGSRPCCRSPGSRSIEIAQNLAGPYAAEILATLGADVLKVERPGGDDARGWGPPFTNGAATTFQTVNRNKRSITLDLKRPADCDRLHGLIAEADVLVQNLRPGALDALGFDAASLRAAHPRLVYCSLWAFGAVGPMRLDPGTSRWCRPSPGCSA